MKLDAIQLSPGKWAVRPEGQLGTMGWHPAPWTVRIVRAGSASEAIRKVERGDK